MNESNIESLEDIISYAEKDNKHAVIMIAKRMMKTLREIPDHNKDINADFGAAIRKRRKTLGLKTVEFARLADTSRENIRRIELGGGTNLEAAEKLAKIVGLSFQEFVDKKVYPKDAENYIRSFVYAFDLIVEELDMKDLKSPWLAVRPDGKVQQMDWNDSQVQSLVTLIRSQLIIKFKELFGDREEYIYAENQHFEDIITVQKKQIEALKKQLKEKNIEDYKPRSPFSHDDT